MAGAFDHFANKRQRAVRALAVLVCAWFASSISLVGEAIAAQKATTSVEAGLETASSQTLPNLSPIPPREVEVVVVWGFRIRTTEHELRVQSVTSGYGELIAKADCMTQMCGFVVVPDGTKWRATNVIAATQSQLQEMQRNMERADTILVIVHPDGTRRTIPQF